MIARYTDTTPQKIQRLHDLILLKAFENTDKYDPEIDSLTADLDYFNFGIKKTK